MKDISLYILFILLIAINALWVYAVGGLLGWLLPGISAIVALIAMIYRDDARL